MTTSSTPAPGGDKGMGSRSQSAGSRAGRSRHLPSSEHKLPGAGFFELSKAVCAINFGSYGYDQCPDCCRCNGAPGFDEVYRALNEALK